MTIISKGNPERNPYCNNHKETHGISYILNTVDWKTAIKKKNYLQANCPFGIIYVIADSNTKYFGRIVNDTPLLAINGCHCFNFLILKVDFKKSTNEHTQINLFSLPFMALTINIKGVL